MSHPPSTKVQDAEIYLCPDGCGCTWRDNHDGTMSLAGPNSKSCKVCEFLPLAKLMPLFSRGKAPHHKWQTIRSHREIENQSEWNAEYPRDNRLHDPFEKSAGEAQGEAPQLCIHSVPTPGCRRCAAQYPDLVSAVKTGAHSSRDASREWAANLISGLAGLHGESRFISEDEEITFVAKFAGGVRQKHG